LTRQRIDSGTASPTTAWSRLFPRPAGDGDDVVAGDLEGILALVVGLQDLKKASAHRAGPA
jgi:hypothetical protein